MSEISHRDEEKKNAACWCTFTETYKLLSLKSTINRWRTNLSTESSRFVAISVILYQLNDKKIILTF